jgi:hypothetical protein
MLCVQSHGRDARDARATERATDPCGPAALAGVHSAVALLAKSVLAAGDGRTTIGYRPSRLSTLCGLEFACASTDVLA